MRILAIRGHNLTSLAEPFEVDLTAEPLAGTGLFAITGDTGAGKSTILDAMCLALYGQYPRASDAHREHLPDPSGDAISAGDPGNILRRSAGYGYAEVDFIGRDGHSYRARWDIRRARSKARGKLQKPGRKLERLDGSGAVATGIKDVLAAVEERTGLTFEQFRRTVLLAQGEFDAFLLADDTRRADLLEKITGTGIYSAISISVFEETAARRRALEEMTRRRAEIAVLSAQARVELQAEQAGRLDAETLATAEREWLDRNLRHADDLIRAQRALSEAGTALEAAETASRAAVQEREELTLLCAVAPLRARTDAVAASIAGLEEAAVREAEAHQSLHAAEQDDAVAAAALSTAADALHLAQGDVHRFEPAWAEAASLDTRIETARAEVGDAARIEAEARMFDARRRAQAAAARAAADQLRQQCEATGAALASASMHAALARDIAQIERRLSAHRELTRRSEEAERRLQADAAEAAGIATRLEAATERQLRERRERERLSGHLDTKRDALLLLDLTALALRENDLRTLAGVLDAALAAAQRRDEAGGSELIAARSAWTAEQARETAATTCAEAVETHGQHTAARAELARLADLADATLSKRAGELRSTLVEGEPCPVCGATDHPLADGDDAATRLAHEIRERRVELDRSIARCAGVMVEAQGAQADALARRDAARRSAEAERRRRLAAETELAALAPGIAEALSRLGLHTLDGAPALADLRAAADEVATARRDADRQRQIADALRAEVEQLQSLLIAAAAAAERAAAADAQDRARQDALAREGAVGRATLEALGGQIADTLADLAPALIAADVEAAALARDPAGAQHRIRRLADAYKALAAHSAEVMGRSEEALRACLAAEDAANSAAATHAQSRAALAARRQSLDGLIGRRTGMLEGMPTVAHRDLIRNAEAAARHRHDDARTRRAEADRALAMARAAHRDAVERHAAATSRQAAAADELAAGISALGLTQTRAAELLAVPPDRIAALGQHVTAVDRRLAEARQARDLRLRDLDTLRADGPVPDDGAIEAMRADREARTVALDALRVEIAQIEVRLANDDEARSRAGEIDSSIAAARAELAIWEDVDRAIGQKDGAKFRRFAQSVTLGHLVRLANMQLEALNPRYALKPSALADQLSIEVIDRDMDGEVRGPRSLSGGERFLVSLALALALASLEGRQSFVDTLFIDEGFGALDRETLDMAIAALETLQGHGRKVGVITHVPAIIERVPVQVRVEMRGGGRSVVRIDRPAPVAAEILQQAAAAAE